MAVGDDEGNVRARAGPGGWVVPVSVDPRAADPVHSTQERGKIVREPASAEHTDPFGRKMRISRQTLDRWIRDWRAGGFDALVPNPRQCIPRTPAEVLELAVAQRRENPDRTAASDPPDPAHPAGLGARRTHPAAQLPPARAHWPGYRVGVGGVRPVRGPANPNDLA